MVWIRGVDGSSYTNPRLGEYFGDEKPAYDLESWLHCLHPDDRARARQAWESFLRTGEGYEIRLRVRRGSDQSFRWLVVRVFSIKDASGTVTHTAGTLMDVHSLEHSIRRMEKLHDLAHSLSGALTKSEVAEIIVEKALTATGADNGFFIEVDPETNQKSFAYGREMQRYAVKPIEILVEDPEMPGYEACLTGKPLFLKSSLDILQRFPKVDVYAQGKILEGFIALPLRAEDRTIGVLCFGFTERMDFDVDFENFTVALSGQCAQAIERARVFESEVKARAELEQTQARLQLALAIAEIGLWEWNLKSKKFWSGGSYAKIFGYETLPENWDGPSFLSHVHPEDRADTTTAFEKRYGQHEETSFTRDLRIVTRQGKNAWIRAAGTITRDETGQAISSYGVVLDITSLKEIEEVLKQGKSEAEEADRAKTSFVANMSHEFRTPLTAILGFAEFLAKDTLEAGRRANYVDGIRRNGQVLLKLVEDILDLSKVEAGRVRIDLQPTNPRLIIEDVLELFRAEFAKKRIEIKVDGLSELPNLIVTDPVRFRQILVNLIGNSLKFTDQGSVQLEVKIRQIAGTDYLEACVTDTGVGISAEQAVKLFEAFGQADAGTNRKYAGTGLGLFISRGLARALGGDVELLRSARGNGSQFIVRIADLKEKHNASLRATLATSSFSDFNTAQKFKGRKVLIVEDTEDLRDFLGAFLKEAGCEIDFARDGVEAIEKASNALHDIVLMDLHMPNMDGYEATERLRADGYRIPIVAVTARNQPEDRIRCFEIGFDAFLSKPISLRDLEGTIQRLLRRK